MQPIQEQLQTPIYFEYELLPQTPPLSPEYVVVLDSMIAGPWTDAFQCITALRSIVKHNPTLASDVVTRYSANAMDLINTGKTQLVKNVLSLIKETFRLGKYVNVEKCVDSFVRVLIKKSANEHGLLKEMADQALLEFTANCGYDVSFMITTELSCDKNVNMSQVAIRQLAKLIENIGGLFSQLKPQTLQRVMKCLTFLLNSKRQNVKSWGLQICMHIYGIVGPQNYLQLINFVLTNEQQTFMISAMDTKKESKYKDVKPLNVLLKERKTMLGESTNKMPDNPYRMDNQENYPNGYNYPMQ